MKVKELIARLDEFNSELDVVITDGYEAVCYHTEGAEMVKFEDEKGFAVVDIGIGGLRI